MQVQVGLLKYKLSIVWN